jgi:YbgC/YbaW family acyl-CoA thioester hydrolase
MAFIRRIPVRFEDVDYARIIYFPNLFSYCHKVFADFFSEEMSTSYAEMIQVRKVGFPIVHAEVDFKSPLRFGDVSRVEMEVVKLSNRSIDVGYRHYRGEGQELCADARVVVAVISMDSFSAIPIPDDIRQAFARHIRGAAHSP